MESEQETTPDAARELPHMRVAYAGHGLTEEQSHADPFVQFEEWFAQAADASIAEPNAMALASVSADGRPSVRMLLLKGLENREFLFYTNYESRKGRELEENPNAALVFYWAELERQVRVEGRVRRLSGEQSDAYFASRPKGSRLAAWVSAQSRAVRSREDLEAGLRQLEREYQDTETVPRPAHWGGYALRADLIEFWQGRPNRLHDRLVYAAQPDGTWSRTRLAP